jgi:gliding motility-associated-like protein
MKKILLVSCLISSFAFGQVVINEIMINPAGGNTDACIQSMATTTSGCGSEYIELYNNDACDPIDISCYFIGSSGFGAANTGAFCFPQGTVIPPLGHLVVGGPNSSLDPGSVDILLNDFIAQPNLCLAGSRWFLENQDGWIGLYDPMGVAIDAVYWTSGANQPNKLSTAIEYNRDLCTPSASCNPNIILQRANQLGGVITYVGQTPSAGLTFSRINDGGEWLRDINPSINNTTVGNCNGGICAELDPDCFDPDPNPDPVCFELASESVSMPSCGENNGSISITLNPNQGNYAIEWSHDNALSSLELVALAAGTYSVTISDLDDPSCPELELTYELIGSNVSEVNYSSINHDPCLPPSSPNDFNPPFIVINEVMVAPLETGGLGTINENSLYDETNSNPNAEWMELYNPNDFDVDISCYVLGANTGNNGNGADATGTGGQPNNGALVFPDQTIIPAKGFVTVGGNAANVPAGTHFNLAQLVGNDFEMNNTDRWFLRDVAGYVALYNDASELIDMVYYGANESILMNRPEFDNDLVVGHFCDGQQNLGAAIDGISVISYMGNPTPSSNQTFQRVFDGSSNWIASQPTPAESNGEQEGFSCNGVITIDENPNWEYIWPEEIAGTNQNSAGGFCPGNYEVIVIDENGCEITLDVSIEEEPFPIASFTASPESGIAPLTVIFENSSDEADSYFWNFGNGEEVNTFDLSSQNTIYSEPGEYEVFLVLEKGTCIDTAFILISVDKPLDVIYSIPNIFTPNGDGVNDFFTINAQNIQSLDILIMNRWGNVVFESNNIDAKWNGKNKNEGKDCSDGTYFYKINIVGEDGQEIEEHGYVKLVRSGE